MNLLLGTRGLEQYRLSSRVVKLYSTPDDLRVQHIFESPKADEYCIKFEAGVMEFFCKG